MNGSSDRAEVVAGALRKHRAAFARFVRARVPPTDATDILQTAALRALERASSLQNPERVVAWLYQVHRNIIQDAARARYVENRIIDRLATPREQEDELREESCECSVWLAGDLPSGQAEVLALVDLGDVAIADAASSLRVSVNAATVRLHRARKALRARLLNHCGVSSAAQCRNCRCSYDGCCRPSEGGDEGPAAISTRT